VRTDLTVLVKYLKALENTELMRTYGKVTKVIGLVIEGHGPGAAIGNVCAIEPKGESTAILAEVVGFRENVNLLMPLGEAKGLGPGSRIVSNGHMSYVKVGERLLGRVIDALGNPIDDKGPIFAEESRPLYLSPISPLARERIKEPLPLGLKAIDGFLTCGKGQRLGIFSGSGIGKSTLLGMITRNTEADINLIALIGERGREVREFIEKDLGDEGLKRSVVVVATADQPPLIRVRAAFVATAIAEYFRDQGAHVLLMMDSLTRFAMAQREIGLAIGEPPATKAYTPSVFALLPKLLERAGPTISSGTITGLYTVLVEGDDMNEPIADAARAILDGHIVLTRELATKNHYPAIDILRSISRLMIDIVSREHWNGAQRLKSIMATYKEAEDLINIGAYVSGNNPKIDYAISMIDQINHYLVQDIEEKIIFKDSLKELFRLLELKTEN
jgi:flagellum-specific ATP synthase